MPISTNGRWPVKHAVAVTFLLLAATAFVAGAPPSPPPLRRAARHWTPANFRGLTLGRSRLADALRLLGAPNLRQPSRSLLSKGGEELIYKARGDHKGDLAVRLDRSGIIVEIHESFPVAIPRTRIDKELGTNALTTHDSIARCAGDLLYRDPSGPIELTLYPERGIVLWPDQYGYDFAAILYLAQPPGASRPPVCVSRH